MQIGRPLMSDSAATDNFARSLTCERTEFRSDPDFSLTSISKTHMCGKNQFPRKFAIAAMLFEALFIPALNNFMCGTFLDSTNKERFVDLYI